MEDIKLTNKSTKSGSEETHEELKENIHMDIIIED